MADLKISQFPAASSVDASDVLAGVQSGTTKKFSLAVILAWIKSQLHLTAKDVGAAADSCISQVESSSTSAHTYAIGDRFMFEGELREATAPINAGDTITPGTNCDTVTVNDSFVPSTRTINGKALSTDISLDSSDIDYDNTGSGLTATDVQEAIDELAQGGGGGGPSPATATPIMDGTGAVGSSLLYAREDHEHPSDTAKQDSITASGILKGDGAGGVSAATAGTDYQAPLTAGTDYATPAQLAGKANQTQLAYVETGTTATKPGGYTAGEYISWQGTLYTANTNIAYGTTLSAGTGGNLTECVGGGFNDRSTGTVGRGTITSGTILSASLVRWSRVVVCTCQLYGLSGINRADCVPFRMPEGFRPNSDTNVQLVFNDGNNGKQWITYGTLKSDGYVSANNAVLGSFAPNVTAIQIQSAIWII